MKLENITISANEKINLLSNIATMLSAGISILETIDSLLEDSKGNQKKILETIKEDLTQGRQLSVSFARFPNVFDNVTVNIIKASEQAGTLDVTLKDLRNYLKKEQEFSDKVKAALMYPVLIIFVFAGVLLMILTFVIPKISAVFSRLRVELPLPTRILIFISNLLLTHTIEIALGTILSLILLFLLYSRKKSLFLNLLFTLPLVSKLSREIDLTHFTRSLYLLLGAGIPIINTLDLTEEIVTKNELKRAIRHCRDLVFTGKKLSEGFKDNKNLFPSIMIKITEAGEKSGSLDKSMQEVSEYLDYEVTRSLQTAITLLEPLMLIGVGILVGSMVLSIIAPIYGLIGEVGGR
ncbi:type II secretion system F family protein [Candidatus Gottesmanbacteria bacterium]|nr:type II secretion system F family protein [Candidatus Gottesmanbacteria bacterium]